MINFLASSPLFGSNIQGPTQAPAEEFGEVSRRPPSFRLPPPLIVLALAMVQVTGARQTVAAGPNTNGAPTFLPATSVALTGVTLANVSAGSPLVVSAANGADANGNNDAVGVAITNLAMPTLTANAVNYLDAIIAAGALTLGVTAYAPIYQYGGAASVTAGQFTFNTGEMKGYLGNDVTAAQANVVFLGELVTNGVGVTSSVAYSFNGRYDSGLTATLAGSGTPIPYNHNLGTVPANAVLRAVCTSADNGYSVGDTLTVIANTTATSTVPPMTTWQNVSPAIL